MLAIFFRNDHEEDEVFSFGLLINIGLIYTSIILIIFFISSNKQMVNTLVSG